MRASPVRIVDPASRSRSLPRLMAGGLDEIRSGAVAWRVWHLLGSADVRRRYARSRLGQLWIILSTAVTFSCMAMVWSYLWKIPVAEFLPYVAASYVVWLFISSVIGESTNAFPDHKGYFSNQNMPIANIIFAVGYRNVIVFGLNLILPLGIALGFGVRWGWSLVLAVPGFALTLLACLALSFLVAILCARFRDFTQLTGALLQVAFYLSPILWKPEQLPEQARAVLAWNPFAVLIAIVRDPLLGRPVSLTTWLAALILVALLALLALIAIGTFRRRVVYWL